MGMAFPKALARNLSHYPANGPHEWSGAGILTGMDSRGYPAKIS